MSTGIRLLLAIFTFVMPIKVTAYELSGSDNAEFKMAVNQWLQDNDRKALPALRDLAIDGNQSARYLLSQIERTTHFASESHYIKELDRKNRQMLLRAAGGLNGTPWLFVLEKEGEDLAEILGAFNDPRFDFEQINRLLDAGEKGLANYQKHRLLGFGNYNVLRKLNLTGNLKNGERYFLWSAVLWDKEATVDEKQNSLIAMNSDIKEQGVDSALMFAYFYSYISPKNKFTEKHYRFGKMLRYPINIGTAKGNSFSIEEFHQFASWLEQKAPTAEKLTLPYVTCKRLCPSEVGQCMAGTLSLAGGYMELGRFISPLETLISYNQYIVSDRAQNSMLRRLKWQALKQDHNKTQSLSVCLSEVLQSRSFNY